MDSLVNDQSFVLENNGRMYQTTIANNTKHYFHLFMNLCLWLTAYKFTTAKSLELNILKSHVPQHETPMP